MQAVILSAGKGTRLPDISKSMPKVMAQIGGKPLLLWHVENLKKQKITDLYINLHYMPEKITEYFGNGKKFGVSLTYSYEKELLGTAGALSRFAPYLHENTLIIYGDVLVRLDFTKLLSFHKKNNAFITAVVQSSSHPVDSDLVNFDKNYQVTKILKKPHPRIPENPYSLAALYVFSPRAFMYLKKEMPSDIAQDFLPYILQKKWRLLAYVTDEFLMDVGTPDRLDKAKELLEKQ